ncbi:unnamed protein product [Prunus armeniaca]|uniref:Uncharacterized protein n=1 Tax=Prunus armeniaca TaxID=36596 RepID=A0A6J5VFZ6_PRUAR|nr:unnamed protein product [Prunus armeniaca]CAB4318381.1 unnamed protein product [Prunus armeniaca]
MQSGCYDRLARCMLLDRCTLYLTTTEQRHGRCTDKYQARGSLALPQLVSIWSCISWKCGLSVGDGFTPALASPNKAKA